jgi:tetratricopeptide (TPR) repeat protein
MALGSTPEIDRLQTTVDAEPNNAAALLQLANKLHDQSATSPQLLFRSVEAYKKYLVLKPDDPDARVDLGICYFYLTRIDTVNASQLISMALNEMQTVAKAHPNHQGAAFNIGIVSLNVGNTEESSTWFKKAVEINPNSDMGARAKKLLEQHSFVQ